MKKFLSLVLSLAMVFSMFTFLGGSAGAAVIEASATYSDYNDILYKEAVDVITALEIMGGYGGGTFGPTGGLTRGAATKIVCNMMVGPSTANKLPAPTTTQFTDVPGSHTFAATISYCAEQGYISGYSDGSFHPGDPLSGNAFMKMLLCALGYDQTIEKYKDTSAWATNVVARAVEVGVADDLPDNFDGRSALTRDQAALLAFNTLQADMVEYESKSTVTIGDATVAVGNDTAKTRVWRTSNTNANNISNKTTTDGNIVQFAELKFNNLKKDDNPDDFGKPSTKWTWHGDEIGTYADAVAKRYWGGKNREDIYKDLGLTSAEYAEFYVNGVRQANVELAKNVSRYNDLDEVPFTPYRTSDAGKYYGNPNRIGDGSLIEVFYDRDDDANKNNDGGDCRIQICATIFYAGKIDSVKRASGSDPRKVTILFAYDPWKTPTGKSEDTEEFDTNLFAADDIVIFTYAAGEIQTVEKLTESRSGDLTRYSRGNSLTINGSTFGYSTMVAFTDDCYSSKDFASAENPTDKTNENLSTNNSYIAYLSNKSGSNLAMWVEELEGSTSADNSTDYAMVRWIDSAGLDADGRDSNQARLLLPNGTQRTVDLYKDYLKDWVGNDWFTEFNPDFDYNENNSFDNRMIVHYSQRSDGTYTLSLMSGKNYAQARHIDISSTSLGDWDIDGDSARSKCDSSTRFVVDDDGTYRTYTGVRNVPNANDVKAVAYRNSSGTVKYVWIEAESDGTTVEITSKDVTFIAAASRSDLYEDEDGTYYTYNAVVANEIKTVRVDATAFLDDGSWFLDASVTADNAEGKNDEVEFSVILNRTNTDTDDTITGGSFSSSSTEVNRAYGVKAASGGQIEVDTHSGRSSHKEDLPSNLNNVNAYLVDDDGNISRLNSVLDIEADSSAWVFYTVNVDDDYITNIFVCET